MNSRVPQAPVISPVIVYGDKGCNGAYVLRLEVARPLYIAFGRFNKGRPVVVSAGGYLYVGSAMGQRGSSALAPRLLRHATRTAGHPPHRLRPILQAALAEAGLVDHLEPPAHKRLFWHADYLLDSEAVEITHALVFRSQQRLERPLACFLQDWPGVQPLARGLGASDVPGGTHLLRLEGGREAWRQLVAALVRCDLFRN